MATFFATVSLLCELFSVFIGPVYLCCYPTVREMQKRGDTKTTFICEKNSNVGDETSTTTTPNITKVYYIERFNEQYLLISIGLFIAGGSPDE